VRLAKDSLEICQKCKRQIVEIEHYGERLIGCTECNRWSWQGSKHLFMELPEEDVQALRARLYK
jgi:hypothetical protein